MQDDELNIVLSDKFGDMYKMEVKQLLEMEKKEVNLGEDYYEFKDKENEGAGYLQGNLATMSLLQLVHQNQCLLLADENGRIKVFSYPQVYRILQIYQPFHHYILTAFFSLANQYSLLKFTYEKNR